MIEGMYEKLLIDKVLITLEIGEKTCLFILLGKDGTIHRKGDGSAKHELPLHRGISPQRHFDAFMMTVNEAIFAYSGIRRQPNMKGDVCSLTIIFQGPNNVDFPFRVIYGADSEGPPRELAELLINAVKITESWYQEQLAEPQEEPKKSWKFWK
jgi:hypothetical protein